jgi:hypothetical protein
VQIFQPLTQKAPRVPQGGTRPRRAGQAGRVSAEPFHLNITGFVFSYSAAVAPQVGLELPLPGGIKQAL